MVYPKQIIDEYNAGKSAGKKLEKIITGISQKYDIRWDDVRLIIIYERGEELKKSFGRREYPLE